MSELIAKLNNISPQWAGVMMAMFIAVIRVIYDDRETRPLRIFLESLLCGGLALTANYGVMALGLNQNWSIFMGGVIGYLGSSSVKLLAHDIIKDKFK